MTKKQTIKNALAAAILILSAGTAAAATAQANIVKELEPYTAPLSKPANPGEMVFMPDGKQYVELSGDFKRLILRDVRTGNESGVLFDVANARETTLPSVEGFALSPDASKILLWRNSSPVYRRSFKAEYYVYANNIKYGEPPLGTFFVPDSPHLPVVKEPYRYFLYFAHCLIMVHHPHS